MSGLGLWTVYITIVQSCVLGHNFESKYVHKFNELVLNELVSVSCILGLWNSGCVRESVPKPAILAQARHAGTHKPLSAWAVRSGEVIWSWATDPLTWAIRPGKNPCLPRVCWLHVSRRRGLLFRRRCVSLRREPLA